MASKNDREGKLWEKECQACLTSIPKLDLYLKSGNSTLPDNDLYGTYRGLSIRCECKNTITESLRWSEFEGARKGNQIRTLQRNHETGGLSFLAISRLLENFERRVWVCSWENFLSLKQRSPSGGSFSLVEPVNHMLESVPFRPEGWTRKGSLPYFDFEPFLEREFSKFLVREMSLGQRRKERK